MTNYIITEEELSIFLRLSAVKKHETDLTFKEIADDFLKDKQPVELLAEDYKLQQKAINTLNDSGLKLMEENKALKSQLSNIKTLDRQEVEKIVGSNVFFDEDGDVTEAYPEDIITAICNLALPNLEVNK